MPAIQDAAITALQIVDILNGGDGSDVGFPVSLEKALLDLRDALTTFVAQQQADPFVHTGSDGTAEMRLGSLANPVDMKRWVGDRWACPVRITQRDRCRKRHRVHRDHRRGWEYEKTCRRQLMAASPHA